LRESKNREFEIRESEKSRLRAELREPKKRESESREARSRAELRVASYESNCVSNS